MSDETKTEITDKTGGDTAEPKLSQADVDRIVAQRLERERSKYHDYDELRKKAETLEAEMKKRTEAEMTELERAKAALQEKEQAIADLTKDRKSRRLKAKCKI